jgi:hypothetical protein
VRLSEIMALANELAGCEQTPADSQIYLDGDVQRVLFGIDIDVGELLLAREIGADGVIAHHPMGSRARLGFPQMVERHELQMIAEGIDQEVAHRIMLARKLPVQRSVHAVNHGRVTDAVRLLKMPAMNIHLAADLLARRHFEAAVRAAVAAGCETAGDLIDALRRIPEFQHSLVQPELWLGRPENAIGRWGSRWRQEQTAASRCSARTFSTASPPSWRCISIATTSASWKSSTCKRPT